MLLSRTESRITEAELATMLPPPTEFPLHCTDPSDRTRFAYAAFLLNKVLECAPALAFCIWSAGDTGLAGMGLHHQSMSGVMVCTLVEAKEFAFRV